MFDGRPAFPASSLSSFFLPSFVPSFPPIPHFWRQSPSRFPGLEEQEAKKKGKGYRRRRQNKLFI
jgi:hypothetical protein